MGGNVLVVMTDSDACEPPEMSCWINLAVWDIPNVAHQPEWLGGEPAFAWTNWVRGADSNLPLRTIKIAYHRSNADHDELPWPKQIDIRSFLLHVSANLPRWAYIYVPPDKNVKYPLMLNQGEILLFVEPLNTLVSRS